jgi:hypothetical protein
MDEEKRRSLHQLVSRASEKDAQAYVAIEEMIVSFDRNGAAEDVAQALEILRALAPEHVYQTVIMRLQTNDQSGRQQWPMYG